MGRVKSAALSNLWIALQKADVLAFQEIASAPDLRQRLSEIGFEYFEPTKPVAGRKKLVAIASRKPLKRISPFTRLPHSERAISCLVSIGRKEAELHCVHVPHGSGYAGIKIEFLEKVISGLSTREGPQFLVGDFNCPQVMDPEESKIVTWAKWRSGKDDPWRPMKSYKGVGFERWDSAERLILRPKADMKDAYTSVNGVAKDTYPAKARGGPGCFDHMIASDSIMPRRICVAADVLKAKLSDHAALVAEWDE